MPTHPCDGPPAHVSRGFLFVRRQKKPKDWPDPEFVQQPVGQRPWGHNLVLCKCKNKVVAEYALRSTKAPIGVAEYQLVEVLPKDLQANLPSVEQIERELGEELGTEEEPHPPRAFCRGTG